MLERYFGELFPGARVDEISALGEESQPEEGTQKSLGYGKPLRVNLTLQSGETRRFVFHIAASNEFGHDRRSDRAADALLAFDTFPLIPSHAAVVDVGAVAGEGLLSLKQAGEFYIVTEFAEGATYAESLSQIGARGTLEESDTERCVALADYLTDLHAEKLTNPGHYRRSIRDLVGHGEGIFGLVDSFPDDAAGAKIERIDGLERRCVRWRRRLGNRHARLARIHGDFHPFNILFGPDQSLALLDASRGCAGDPADDATCLAVNYLFFGLENPEAGAAFGELWNHFWTRYLTRTADEELLAVAPPFLAWRVLVLTNPLWYPNVTRTTREALLGFAERSLDLGRVDLAAAAELLR